MTLGVNSGNSINNALLRNSLIIERTSEEGIFGSKKKTEKITYTDDDCKCKKHNSQNEQNARLMQYLAALMIQIMQSFQELFQQIAEQQESQSCPCQEQNPRIIFISGNALNCTA